jgi:hypothetical protein
MDKLRQKISQLENDNKILAIAARDYCLPFILQGELYNSLSRGDKNIMIKMKGDLKKAIHRAKII